MMMIMMIERVKIYKNTYNNDKCIRAGLVVRLRGMLCSQVVSGSVPLYSTLGKCLLLQPWAGESLASTLLDSSD